MNNIKYYEYYDTILDYIANRYVVPFLTVKIKNNSK